MHTMVIARPVTRNRVDGYFSKTSLELNMAEREIIYMIEVFKIYIGIDIVKKETVFQAPVSEITRGHSKKDS